MKKRILALVMFFAICLGIGLYAYRDGLRQQAVDALHRITEETILYHQAITYLDEGKPEQTELLHDPRQAEVVALFQQVTKKDILLCEAGAYGHDHALYLCLTDQTELLFDLHLEENDTFHFGLASTNRGYHVTLPGLTDLLWGTPSAADPSISQTPSTDPVETVRSAIEAWAEEEYTISIRFEGAQVDEEETAFTLQSLLGSERAADRGWSDEYLAEHYAVVRATYFAEYDHTKTPAFDGHLEQLFYLVRDAGTGKWMVTDMMTASKIDDTIAQDIKLDGMGLTLLLPESWQGQCGVETDEWAGETYYKIYHKGIRDAFAAQSGGESRGGVLFSVRKVSDEQLTEAEVTADSGFSASHNRYITAKEDGTYLLFYASDVQFTEDTMALYRRFESEIADIRFAVGSWEKS